MLFCLRKASLTCITVDVCLEEPFVVEEGGPFESEGRLGCDRFFGGDASSRFIC